MASQQNARYLVDEKPSQPPKPSNEDRVYGIANPPYPQNFITPRQPQLRTYGRQTYTSSKLRSITTTPSRPNETGSSAEPSRHVGSAPSREDQRHFASTSIMQGHGPPVDDPVDITLLTDKPQHANGCLPSKPTAAIRKELREVSRDNTPVARRMERRRQQSLIQAQSEITKRRSDIWVPPVHRRQASEISATKQQHTSKIVQADQYDDSQDSKGTEESLNFEEAIRKARQEQPCVDNKRKHYMPTTTRESQKDILIRFDLKDSDSEFADSPSSKEGIDLDESTSKVPQQSQSLLGIEPKDMASSVRLSRHKNFPIIPEEQDENPESADSDGSNQEEDEDQLLEDLDMEILGLGNDHNGLLNGHRSSPDISSSRSPKRRRPSPDRVSRDLYDLQNETEEAEDKDFEQPTSKKRRRSSRINQKVTARGTVLKELKGRRASKETQLRTSAKDMVKSKIPKQPKKTPRSLPVDELVLVSEKLNNSDAEDDRETPIEPPENPISQLSLSLEESRPNRNGKKFFRRLDIKLKQGKGFGAIDISEFRMPETPAAMAEAERQGTRSHSDGFEGQEAQPTGRLMPVRKKTQYKPTFHKLTIRFRELTLVAERPYDQERPSEDNHSRRPRAKKEKRHNQPIAPVTPGNEQHDGSDSMLIDNAEERPMAGDDVLEEAEHELQPAIQKQITPQNTTSEKSPLQPPTRSSPLQKKEQHHRKVTLEDETTVAVQLSQSASTQSGASIRRHDSNEVSVSQQLKMISAPKVVVPPKKKEIAIDHQLMMVSIPRSSIGSDDSEDDSDEESYAENESESDEDSENSEEERSDTPEEDTDEESDLQSENEIAAEEEVENVDILEQQNNFSGSPRVSDWPGPPSPGKIEVHIPPIVVRMPTLRREDAQNPILEMVPRNLHKTVKIPSKPTPRRRSARLSNQQPPQSHEVIIDTTDKMLVGMRQEKDRSETTRKRSVPIPVHDNNDDDSWRPREPVTGSVVMEIEDDEIVDTPSPVRDEITSSNRRRDYARRLSLMASQALTIVASRPSIAQEEVPAIINHDSQGSIELGNTQRLLPRSLRSVIPETQMEQADQDPEGEREEADGIRMSQATFIPGSSYFEHASQDLQKPVRKPSFVRSKSMSASMHTPRRAEGESGMMTGGISMTAAFQHTISPIRTFGPMPTALTLSGKDRSLKSLTRQASIELGTLPSGRKSQVSLPFYPPFKKS